MEHRIEFVAEKGGVAYYNDSKGTNPDAAIKAVQAMRRPTVLIGGGYDKQSDYREWIESFGGKVKQLVLLGETKEKIASQARACGFTDIVFADTFDGRCGRLHGRRSRETRSFCLPRAQAGICLRATRNGAINSKRS